MGSSNTGTVGRHEGTVISGEGYGDIRRIEMTVLRP
jgi:hypothetical protein